MPKVETQKSVQDTEKNRKSGFLGLDFKVGESLPNEVWPHSGIPVKVGEKGELLWQFRPMEEVFKEQIQNLSEQQKRKWDVLWRLISKSFRTFKMAAVFGYPVRTRQTPFLSNPLQNPPLPPEFLKQESWGNIPVKIQEHVLRGAYQFRYPGVTFDAEGNAHLPKT